MEDISNNNNNRCYFFNQEKVISFLTKDTPFVDKTVDQIENDKIDKSINCMALE